MAELAVTAIGADRPGIVATIAEVLHDRGGNVEDSAMTLLRGHFAIMLVVEIDDGAGELEDALADATAPLGLFVSVTSTEAAREAAEPTHVLSVYGADRPGILAGVTRALAEQDANITDMSTRLLSPGDAPVYAMVLEVHVPDGADVAGRLTAVCGRLGVDHTLRPLDAETY